MRPTRVVVLDIDGLRRDVFFRALANERLPAIARILGGPDAKHGLHLEPVSTAPSITFGAQASMFTGAPASQTGLPGNQFFDRFGQHSNGAPRFYALDVGDTLALDDAVAVFSGQGLVNSLLSPQVTTLYEHASQRGLISTVVYNMLARGAKHWLRPSLIEIARLTKGGGLVGMAAEAYDRQMLTIALAHLQTGIKPDVFTLYFMGLDHRSHRAGPDAQYAYLTEVIDPLIDHLLRELDAHDMMRNTLFVIASDHGQVAVTPDDQHSLRLSFPFDREMGYVFDALGLDVHDFPGEDPNCDAVVASNGGLAQVYLQNQLGHWRDKARFSEDVLPVARAFWEAHQTGRYAADLQGALSLVLVRDVERHGWEANYQALTPEGEVVALKAYLAAHPELEMVEAETRLKQLATPLSGDILLAANTAAGFYFGAPVSGTHGGLHPDESEAVLSFGLAGGSPAQIAALRLAIERTVSERCKAEGNRRPSIMELTPATLAALGW